MSKPTGDGRTRLEAAKASLQTLVDGLPDDARVGLRLYGHRVTGSGRAAGCRDTELVAPVGRLDRPALKAQIGAYRAVGATPIGRALRAAAADLPTTGPSSIVLVSDGGDNCAPPDPCRVAEQIAAEGATVSIQAIGFQVAGRARAQLRCIAEHARGVFRQAENSDELALALRALSARAMRTFRPAGRTIAGGTSERTALPIGTGRFVDAVRPDEERWYSIAIGRGQRLAATAVVVSPCPVDHDVADMIGTSLKLDVVGPASEATERATGIANLFFGDESVEGAGLLTPRVGPQPDGTAFFSRAGRYRLKFMLSDNGLGRLRQAFGAAPFALQIETRLSGGATTAPTPPRSIPPPAASGDRGSTALAPIIGAAIVLGALVGLALTALRRGRA